MPSKPPIRVDRGGSWKAAAAGAALASIPCVWLWHFTVDDALISARVAHNLAQGAGYRFNADGPVVDAVTPLGWAPLLSVVAGDGPLAALRYAKAVGVVAWVASAALLGVLVKRSGAHPRRYAPLLLLALSAPLAAWAVAGMETALVTALATLALARTPAAALAAGLAAAWRPELIPWAAVLATGGAIARQTADREGLPIRAITAALLMALAPAIVVALVRTIVFGSPAPLAVLAKPADLRLGALYSLGTLVFTGVPVLLVAPRALRAVPGHYVAIAAATAVHFVAVALAGGDWMPLNRLAVPVLPGALLAGAAVADRAGAVGTVVRLLVAGGLCAYAASTVGPDAARVGPRRRALIESAREPLAGAERVATVDVGWVGAATGAQVVDLAGVTDEEVAALPGSHTSKRFPKDFFRRRGVDAAVLLEAGGPDRASWDRAADARAAGILAPSGRWVRRGTIPLGGTAKQYVIFRLNDQS